jgi:hypothetical protein
LRIYLNGTLHGGALNLQRATTKAVPGAFKLKDTRTSGSTNPKEVLQEIFEFMEEYGPIWYTEDLHDRIKIALSDYH